MKENTTIQDYIHGILLPLDQFYTAHYSLVQNGNSKEKELLEAVYHLYLEKLEQLARLIEEIEKETK